MVCGNRGRFVNKVRVRKDRHPHNARPRTAPINLVWSYRNLIINGFNLIDLLWNLNENFWKYVPQDSCGMLPQTLRSIVGILFQKYFSIYLKIISRKIFKICLKIPVECYRKRYGIHRRRVKKFNLCLIYCIFNFWKIINASMTI